MDENTGEESRADLGLEERRDKEKEESDHNIAHRMSLDPRESFAEDVHRKAKMIAEPANAVLLLFEVDLTLGEIEDDRDPMFQVDLHRALFEEFGQVRMDIAPFERSGVPFVEDILIAIECHFDQIAVGLYISAIDLRAGNVLRFTHVLDCIMRKRSWKANARQGI